MYGSMMNDMHGGQRRQRFHRGVQANQKQSSSYPRVPSRTSNTRPLLSVQSEGSNLMNRKAAPSAPPVAAGPRRRKVIEDDRSSDESAGEEVIVRVDSPNMLSFSQPSGALQGN